MRNVREQLERITSYGKMLSPDLMFILDGVDDPGRLADLVASNLDLTVEKAQEVLEILDPIQRLKAKMSKEVEKEAFREMDRLEQMHPDAAEASMVRTYLDWLVEMPWSKSTVDNLDLREAKRVLEEDHYDLEKVKERILEYLAVRKLKKKMKGPILCFIGPPGVGKTSLGRSIARALGRN